VQRRQEIIRERHRHGVAPFVIGELFE
jgi:hypothetical protein